MLIEKWLRILDAIGTDYYTSMVQLKPVLVSTCQEMGLTA